MCWLLLLVLIPLCVVLMALNGDEGAGLVVLISLVTVLLVACCVALWFWPQLWLALAAVPLVRLVQRYERRFAPPAPPAPPEPPKSNAPCFFHPRIKKP